MSVATSFRANGARIARVSIYTASLLAITSPAHGQYINRFSRITNGAITFTGNTLGLAKQNNENGPGTAHSIGTFITTDATSRDGTAWPLGTTSDWRLNSASAELRLPPNSTVLYAELVWGGTCRASGADVCSSIDTAVSLTTPAGAVSVAPDPATARAIDNSPRYYVRTANVTAHVQAGGRGTYTVGGVPGTEGTTENNSNTAGWTLAVVYENFSLPVRHLTLFTGLEESGAPPVSVSGFCTPPTGLLAGRLAVSASEGDAESIGDRMKFGRNVGNPADVSGPRNPATNFFASQITDDAGQLDTAGTFGTSNHTAGTAVVGGRQGWDIVNVDVSSHLVHAQTSAFARGTTTGDAYVINALGLQINVGAPVFVAAGAKTVDRAVAAVGDVLTYTTLLNNQGLGSATNVIFRDPPPLGTTFVPNSVTIDGVPRPGLDPGAGFPMDTIAGGTTRRVTFQVLVTSVPPPPAPGSYTNVASWTYDFQSCAGQPITPAQFVTDPVVTAVARIEGAKTAAPSPATPGLVTKFTVTVANTGTTNASGVTLADPIPANTTYVAGSTRLNGVAVPDVGGLMPFVTPQPVNSPGEGAGQVNAGESAIVNFDVLVNPGATGSVVNTGTVEPDGAGALPPFPVTATVPLTPQADVQITKTGPTRVVEGDNVVYTIRVSNRGPSDATGVQVTDPTPTGLTLVSVTGSGCTAFPCTIGGLPASQPPVEVVADIVVTYNVPMGYLAAGGADPIVNVANVTSTTSDPSIANNMARAATAVNAPVADLSISKTNGVTTVIPGSTTTYTITVGNAGPDAVTGAPVMDAFDPRLSNVQWTCAPSAGANCPSSGSGNINTTVNMPVGGTVTFTVTATIDPGATGVLVNTATVTTPPGVSDPSSANNTDTDTLTPQADVRITKTGPAVIVPGSQLTYSIGVNNVGPSNATGVTITDETPAGLTLVSVSGGGCTAMPCSIGTLPPATPQIIRVTYQVPVDYVTPNPIVNTAVVSSTTPDPDTANNTSTASTPVNALADVSVLKSVAPATAVVGDTVTFTVTASNAGPARATGLVITDVIPAGLTLLSATPLTGTYDPATGAWAIVALDSSTISSLALTARVDSPGAIANTATKTAAVQPDPNTANDSSAAVINVSPVADLGVAKSVDRPEPLVGENVTFTITLINQGPNDASGITVVDQLPAGLSFVSATPSQGTYSAPTGEWAAGGLANRASATLSLVATVTQAGVIANTARKTTQAEADRNPANDEASVSLNATPDSDIQVVKAVSRTDPAVGESVDFTVTVRNNGPSNATGVVVTDAIPAGLAFVTATPSQGTYDSASGAWTIGALNATQSAVLTLTTEVGAAGAMTNTATVTAADQLDPNPANNTATAGISAQLSADLTISKTSAPSPYVPGAPMTYTITVTNLGPSPALTAHVQDVLPAPLAAFTWTCSATGGGSCGSPTGTGNIDAVVNLPVGAQAIFLATGTVPPATTGALTNTATVEPPPGGSDPVPGNNSATDTNPVGPQADLVITKSSAPNPYVPGATLTYTIASTNLGPSSVLGARVRDALPTPLDAFAWTCSATGGGACGTPSGTGDIDALVDLPIGGRATFTVTGTVPSATLGAISNVATVASPVGTTDPVPGNNVGADTNPVGPQADLIVTKTSSPNPYVPGAAFTYTLTVTNAGPSDVTNARVQDLLPPAAAAFAWTCAASGGGICGRPGGTGSIDALVTLPSGAQAVFTASGVVPPGTSGTLTNTATVAVPAAITDPVPGNNQATDTNPAGPQADLQVTKTSTPSPYVPGAPMTYTIAIANAGPSDVGSARVLDALPAAASGFSWTCAATGGGACVTTSGTGDIDALVSLPVGAAATITATGTLPADAPPTLTNTATATAVAVADPNPANNSGTNTNAASPMADLSVSKTASATSVLVGNVVTFTIGLGNAGPSSATGVVITDALPTGLTFVEGNASQGVYDPGTGQWTVGTVAPGTTPALTIMAEVAAVGVLTNSAAKTAQAEPDPVVANDSSQAVVRATERLYFAEGATGFFDTSIVLMNPSGSESRQVTLTFLLEVGPEVTQSLTLDPRQRRTVSVNDALQGRSIPVSTVIEADGVVVADRQMHYSRDRRYGSTRERAIRGASPTWYFAEGATSSFFDLYYLLENDGTEATTATITYLPEVGEPTARTYNLAPRSRRTILVNMEHPELIGGNFAAIVTADTPIVVERAMYLGLNDEFGTAGQAGAGTQEPSTVWYFAEGATGRWFDEFLLLANPSAVTVPVEVTYQLPDGSTVEKSYDVGPLGRRTIWVDFEDPRLANTAVAATVTSPEPVVAERAMWWPGSGFSWYEASVSIGSTVTGTLWAIPDGALGGPAAEQTYVLVANTEATPGVVTITLLFDDGSTAAKAFSVPSRGRLTVDLAREFPLAVGSHFGILVESVGAGVPIVVETARYRTVEGRLLGSGDSAQATKLR